MVRHAERQALTGEARGALRWAVGTAAATRELLQFRLGVSGSERLGNFAKDDHAARQSGD